MSATKEHYHNEIEAGMRTKSTGLKDTSFAKGEEHPILFSTEMVKANLEGRKRMTRRLKGLDEINENPNDWQFEWADFSLKKPWCFTKLSTVNKRSLADRSFYQAGLKCPYGKPGDLLWVRETWMKVSWPDGTASRKIITHFKAGSEQPVIANKWRPSIHMPKAVARIWLQVEEVRVERLQNISEEDAMAEGAGKAIFWMHTSQIEIVDPAHVAYPTASYKLGFQKLWISINGIESWHENPWVWVVKYKVISTSGRPITL